MMIMVTMVMMVMMTMMMIIVMMMMVFFSQVELGDPESSSSFPVSMFTRRLT